MMNTIQVEIPAYFKQLLSTSTGYVKAVEVLNEVFSAYFENQADQALKTDQALKSISKNVCCATMLKRQLLQIISDIFEGIDENPDLSEVTVRDYTLEIFSWSPESKKEYINCLLAAFDSYCTSDYGKDVQGEFLDMLCSIRSSFIEILFDTLVALAVQEAEEAAV